MTSEQLKERILADDTRKAVAQMGLNTDHIFNGPRLIGKLPDIGFFLMAFTFDEKQCANVHTTNDTDAMHLALVLRQKAHELAPIPLEARLRQLISIINGMPGMETIFEAVVAKLQEMDSGKEVESV